MLDLDYSYGLKACLLHIRDRDGVWLANNSVICQ